jgi:hypothetical protein
MRNSAYARSMAHIESSLIALGKSQPLFAARLQASDDEHPELVHILHSSANEIPFDMALNVLIDYEDLKNSGFPSQRLDDIVSPALGVLENIPDSKTEPIPVARVGAIVINGGLLLVISVHHSLFDGYTRKVFLDYLWAATAGITSFPPARLGEFPTPGSDTVSVEGLWSLCPELTMLPHPDGPRTPYLANSGTAHDQIERAGAIFMFSESKIKAIQKTICQELGVSKSDLSSYNCIAAFTFAHVVKARVQAEGETYLPRSKQPDQAILRHEVDFRKRAFARHFENYFGNATVSVWTRFPERDVIGACTDHRKLAALAGAIKDSLDAVGDRYVQTRLAVAKSMQDPRRMGQNYDPRQPQVLGFNNWRYLNGDHDWKIPGVPTARPEAFRLPRAHSIRNALIMPRRPGSKDQALFLSLSRIAMDKLCEDEEWMSQVDRNINQG